jgi:capsid protein
LASGSIARCALPDCVIRRGLPCATSASTTATCRAGGSSSGCRRWARSLDVAVMAGALDLPGYQVRRREYAACACLPPRWDWVDPPKDARAESEQIIAERGYDAEQVDAEIAADRAREQRHWLVFNGIPPAGAAPIDAAGDRTG